MKKIKILKSFPTTHYGYLAKGLEYSVGDGFAQYCVEKMKAAEYIQTVKKSKK